MSPSIVYERDFAQSALSSSVCSVCITLYPGSSFLCQPYKTKEGTRSTETELHKTVHHHSNKHIILSTKIWGNKRSNCFIHAKHAVSQISTKDHLELLVISNMLSFNHMLKAQYKSLHKLRTQIQNISITSIPKQR